jgi:hypothetical protein
MPTRGTPFSAAKVIRKLHFVKRRKTARSSLALPVRINHLASRTVADETGLHRVTN